MRMMMMMRRRRRRRRMMTTMKKKKKNFNYHCFNLIHFNKHKRRPNLRMYCIQKTINTRTCMNTSTYMNTYTCTRANTRKVVNRESSIMFPSFL